MRAIYPEDYKCGGCGTCEACLDYASKKELPFRVTENDEGNEAPGNNYWFEIRKKDGHSTDICFDEEDDAQNACDILNRLALGNEKFEILRDKVIGEMKLHGPNTKAYHWLSVFLEWINA